MENGITGELFFRVDNTRYTLHFERYYISNQIERIKVFGKKTEMRLQCDRPEIKLNNKKRAIKWKIISELTQELFKNAVFVNTLLLNLENELDRIDFPKEPIKHWKNT
jgi:hypothetical protein